ncbi:hypothetical protein AB0H76_15255 [Nocardia sp. NPDC050712]|uniref:hypothetical protein n=1 Tax=Nocardia sp. NPDC050712 TaxID=3155518 RepID=UPI0033C1BEDE
MATRKALAGALIRLAHRIYRPQVTYLPAVDVTAGLGGHGGPAVSSIHFADPAEVMRIADKQAKRWATLLDRLDD